MKSTLWQTKYKGNLRFGNFRSGVPLSHHFTKLIFTRVSSWKK